MQLGLVLIRVHNPKECVPYNWEFRYSSRVKCLGSKV